MLIQRHMYSVFRETTADLNRFYQKVINFIREVDYNRATEKMQVNLEAGVAHSYFNNTYASIKVQNSSGSVVYNKEIVGNRQQTAESQTVPVKVGDYIEFTHIEGEAVKEKTRATLINLENNRIYRQKKNLSSYFNGFKQNRLTWRTFKLLVRC